MTVAVGGTNMSHFPWLNKIPIVRVAVCLALIVMSVSAPSCERKPNKPNNAAVGTTGKETQKTFVSPAEAGAAFHDAAKSGESGGADGDLRSRRDGSRVVRGSGHGQKTRSRSS
jgi:hypothetical protein